MVRLSAAALAQGRRRVVVTGIGVVSPLGCGTRLTWNRLLDGEVGVTALKGERFARLPSRVAAVVPEGEAAGQLNLAASFSATERRTMSRATCLSVLAAEEAAKNADWRPETEEEEVRTGVCIGMGMADLEDIVESARRLEARGLRGVSPHFAARILLNMAAGEVSIRLRCRGPNHSVSTACATGAHAVGDAFRLVQGGAADAVFCGSADACLTPLTVAGFAQMRALSTRFNDAPWTASRPMDSGRDGFVLGEGAGVLLLEELEHARRRPGVTVLAEVLGYGLSGDASHVTAPRADGDGARRAMLAALRDACVHPTEVTHVNAHATSTPLGDRIELESVANVLRPEGDPGREPVLVTSCKGAVGHLLGGAGSVETAVAVLSCYHGLIPPTANLTRPDPDLPALTLVAGRPARWAPVAARRRVALKNSFGFGGTNASLCLAEFVQ